MKDFLKEATGRIARELIRMGCPGSFLGTAALLNCAAAAAQQAAEGKRWKPTHMVQSYAEHTHRTFLAVWVNMQNALRAGGCTMTVGQALRHLVGCAMEGVNS